MSSADLASWLLEQIAEDERVARQVVVSYIAHTGDLEHPALDSAIGPGDLDAYMSVDATRVLAECEAKREVLNLLDIAERHFAGMHRVAADYSLVKCAQNTRDALLRAVQFLALPYADRPGYQESWRP